MSSSYFMLKFLRQSRERQTKRTSVNKKNVNRKNIIILNGIKTKPNNDLSQKCRICLKDGTIPIYGDQKHSDISENVKTFATIELDEKDDYPKSLCEACFILLESAILFRKTALESDKYLRESHSKKTETECHNSEQLEVLDSYKNNFDDGEQDFSMDTGFNVELEIEPLHTEMSISKKQKKKTKSNKPDIFDANVLFPKKVNKKVRVQCSICNGLLTPQLYNRHLQRHRLATRLICEICGKMYRRDNIDIHVQSHSTNLPFQCKLCPYRGRFLISLQQHMRVHTGKKPYSCDKCPRQFTCRSNLNKHLLVHNKQRPFTCLQCGKSFFTNSNLEDHMNSYHLGMKYTCDMCGNEFVTRKSLRKHELKIHKREKFLSGRPLYLQPEYNK